MKKAPGLSRHISLGIVATLIILLFSFVMSAVAGARTDIAVKNYQGLSDIYNGELQQSAPSLSRVSEGSAVLNDLDIDTKTAAGQQIVNNYTRNVSILRTDAEVKIKAEFVKKGLEYQPTFQTNYRADYTLSNNRKELSPVAFDFPLPVNSSRTELSNVSLKVNGELVDKAKTKLRSGGNEVDGLRWEGKLEEGEQVKIEVQYETVGISRFAYTGFTNNQGAQDFKLSLTIDGTRSYDVTSGLSVDNREFGKDTVKLTWDKQNLFSTPIVNVAVGNKVSPSTQVSRIYILMAPLFAIFISIVLWLSSKQGRLLRLKDMAILSVLFTLYFPLLHYLTSFTIDPTMEVFSGIANVGNYSLPLYGAFALALAIIGGMSVYLVGAVYGRKFAWSSLLPAVLMFLGFFPLVVTVPEYSVLLILLGSIFLLGIFIRTRLAEK